MKDYEAFLKRLHSEGWKDPVKITDLEIKAYEAGMFTERKRILSILSDVIEGKPMRELDLLRTVDRIKNPNQ